MYFNLSPCRTVSEKNIWINYWICNESMKIYELQYVWAGSGLWRDRLSASLQAMRSEVQGSSWMWHQRFFINISHTEMLRKCMFLLYRFRYHGYAHFKIFSSYISLQNIYIYILYKRLLCTDFSKMHTILEEICSSFFQWAHPRQKVCFWRSLVFVGYNHIIVCNSLRMGQPINKR